MNKKWHIKKLGEISRINYGFTEKANFKEIGPKFLRITDIQDNYVNWENVPFCKIDENELSKYKLKDGDIVFARTGATTGKSFLLKKPPLAVFASYLIRLQILNLNEILPDFLILYFQTDQYWKNVSKGLSGSAQGGFNASKLADLQIPLPPIPEQQRIVKILDETFKKIEKVKENTEKNFKNSHKLFESYLQKALLNKNSNWQTKKLIDACEKITDGSHFSPKSSTYGAYPYITVRDINNDIINFKNCKFIDEASYNQLVKNGCQPFLGDLLFSKDGTVGKVSLVDYQKKFVILSSLAIIRPKIIINPQFLKYILKSNKFVEEAIGKKTGTAIKRIVLKNLKDINISFPESLSEQQKIVTQLDSLSQQTQKLESLYKQKLANLEELKKSILNKAFNGEL